jgi:hypothetical protein
MGLDRLARGVQQASARNEVSQAKAARALESIGGVMVRRIHQSQLSLAKHWTAPEAVADIFH